MILQESKEKLHSSGEKGSENKSGKISKTIVILCACACVWVCRQQICMCSTRSFCFGVNIHAKAEMYSHEKKNSGPDWCGSVGWALPHKAKVTGSIPGKAHVGLALPVGAFMGGNRSIFLSCINASLNLSLPLYPSL